MSDLGPRPTRPDVVVEQRPDPDRPDRGRTQHTVRGARRYDGILSLFGATSPEYRAAERYRDDNAIAAGVRLTERSMVRSTSPTGPRAISRRPGRPERVRAASDAMGQAPPCPSSFGPCSPTKAWRPTSAPDAPDTAPCAATLRLALAALADHYDREDGR